MPHFMIRVELHNATSQNYAALAESLRTIGVVDIVPSSSGARYKLPPAEYYHNGIIDISELRALVAAKAAATNKAHAVVVTQGEIVWTGLTKL